MNAAKYTPGPWEAAGPVGKAIWIQSDAQPNIAAVHGAFTDTGRANAHLIAAAPKLYEALARLLATTDPGTADTHEPGCRCVIHEARAALAEAKGGAQ